MPPRVRIRACQPRRPSGASSSTFRQTFKPTTSIRRYASSDKPADHSTEQLPHINEEKAAVNKTMDKQDGLSAEDMGTPIHEVVKDDPKAKENMPKVVRDEIDKGKTVPGPRTDAGKGTSGDPRGFHTWSKAGQQKRTFATTSKRSFSTSARRGLAAEFQAKDPVHINHPVPEASFDFKDHPGMQKRIEELGQAGDISMLAAELQNLAMENGQTTVEELPEGLKFPLPEEELTRRDHIKHRYEDVVQQFTNLIMKHGRKSRAQTFASQALSYLRTSPPPQAKSKLSPLARSPIPASSLPLNPPLYLAFALDSLGPVLRMLAVKGAIGGGRTMPVPYPLNGRQRRRQATMWILETVDKRKARSVSGFGRRLGEEIVAVVEGRSGAWEKRNTVHRAGVMSRGNINSNKRVKRGHSSK